MTQTIEATQAITAPDQAMLDLAAEMDSQSQLLDYDLAASMTASGDGDEANVIWYLGKVNQFDDAEARIKAGYATIMRQLKAARMALARDHGTKFKSSVDTLIKRQGGKKKSVDVLTGKAGYRQSSESLKVIDEAAAVEWATEHCPDALDVKLARTTPLLKHVKENGGEVPPGCEHVPADNKFFPQIESKAFGLPAWPSLAKGELK